MRIGTWVAVVITSLVQLLVSQSVFAKPRVPQPPWPEQIQQRWDFDAAFWASYGGGKTSTIDFTSLAEGWSGFALQRDGLTTSPFILPGVDSGHANLTTGAGALRFWFSPAWSSTSMNGTGPGHYARLAECVVADGQSGMTAWSLYVNSYATTIYLSGQGTNGATDFLEADISWEAGRWYLLTVNYTTNGTTLFINSEAVAEGAALPAFNPVLAGLAIGSDWTGADLAGGLFDEVTTFAKPIKSDDLAFYYEGTSGMAALGPISAEEVAAQAAHRAEMKALKEAEGEGGMEMMRFVSSEPSGVCITNGPVYLTNIVCYFVTNQNWTVSFDIAGGTNGVPYDIFTTTNLLGGHIANAVWDWDDVGYTCNANTFTNQPTNQTFYILGTTNDTDYDGLTDAFEQLVSKTLISTNDTDGDGMPDKWEWDNHLNPLVNDASDDPDGDWITNLQEYNSGTNSTDPHDTMVIAWGGDSAGQSDVPLNLRRATVVAGGLYHTLVLQGNDTVVVWGDNAHGQTNVPPGLSNVLAIAAGPYHGLALRADGSVTNWGSWFDINHHAVTLPSGLTNMVGIAAGTMHDLALRADGAVTAWSYTNGTFTTVPTNLTSVKAIAAGWNHNVALRNDGTVVAWGDRFLDFGWNLTNVPSGLSNVTAIAAGAFHTLALKANGTVVAWGAGGPTNASNNFLGAEQGQSIVPSGLSNVVAISAGGYHSFALKADGTMVAWGDLSAAPAYANSNLTAIGSGVIHGQAIRSRRLTPIIALQPSDQAELPGTNATFSALGVGLAGARYQWQFNGVNITGATNANLSLTNVQAATEGNYRVIISTGAGSLTSSVATFTLARPPAIVATSPPAPSTNWIQTATTLSVAATAPALWKYPLSYQWQFNGTNIPYATVSNYTIYSLDSSKQGLYSVIITNAAGSTNTSWQISVQLPGMAVAWGANDSGQVDYPLSLSNTLAIAAGEFHSVAVKEDGSVVQWGYEWDDVPADLTNAVAVSAGYDHTLALRNNGTVVSWGDAGSAANSVPTNLAGVKAIAAGWNHNLALLTNGSVTAWGINGTNFGWNRLVVPADLTNATAIAAGALHSLALRDNGTVVAWGYNDVGQTNVPAGLSNVVGIAAGGSHSLALKADGTVTAWGLNTSGQCSVPSGLSNVMAVAAGWAHSVALKNDGTVVAWGRNDDGQTNVITGLNNVKMIAAGGAHTLAGVFSPLVQYPVDVTKDLLLIYNTTSTNSIWVKDYYLAHRPMITGANVLGIGCTTNEVILPAEFTNVFVAQLETWLNQHPTKRPQYLVLFLDIASRVATNAAAAGPGLSHLLHEHFPGYAPFINYINMNGTDDCKAYIDKLEYIGTNYSPGKLIISASAGGYGDSHFYFEDSRFTNSQPQLGLNAFIGVTNVGVSLDSVTYVVSNNVYITDATNVAGLFTWGSNGDRGYRYVVVATNSASLRMHGDSRWYLIQTGESWNGVRDNSGTSQPNFLEWFSANAFGGTNYMNTPVGGVTHVYEPGAPGYYPDVYFGLWAKGKNFAIAAWNSRWTPVLQIVGDPLVAK